MSLPENRKKSWHRAWPRYFWRAHLRTGSSSHRYLHRFMPSRHYACSVPADLQTSRPPCLRIYTRAARLQLYAATPPYLQCRHECNGPPELRTSIPPRCVFASSAPAACAPSLSTSVPPYLHACSRPPDRQSSMTRCLHVSTSARPRASELASPTLHLYRTSRSLYLHVSTPAYLHKERGR